MPSLQMHQYRVAGVAEILCKKLNIGNDTQNIIAACLLHDMGNILKFKLDLYPEFLLPEGADYWAKIKADYHQKYGNDEHKATIEIAQEILCGESGLKNKELRKAWVLELIDAIGFSNAECNFESNDISRKIVAYADMRVEPYGVTSLTHRLADGHKRFKLHKPEVKNELFFSQMSQYLKKIEQQLFAKLDMQPEDITEELVQQQISSLQQFDI